MNSFQSNENQSITSNVCNYPTKIIDTNDANPNEELNIQAQSQHLKNSFTMSNAIPTHSINQSQINTCDINNTNLSEMPNTVTNKENNSNINQNVENMIIENMNFDQDTASDMCTKDNRYRTIETSNLLDLENLTQVQDKSKVQESCETDIQSIKIKDESSQIQNLDDDVENLQNNKSQEKSSDLRENSLLTGITDNNGNISNGIDENVDDEGSNDLGEDLDKDDDMEDMVMSPGFICGLSSSTGGQNTSGMQFTMNGHNVSTHTFRKTEWDVKKMENYVKLSFGDSTAMENMEPSVMNRYLKSFFELAKKSDGMDYEPESLIGFMNSFERYLKTKNYPESLLRSDSFKESRNVLKKKRDLVRSIGKLIRTKTKDTCYLLQFHRNLLKEKNLLNRDNPDCLLAEIYLNNMIYFGEFLKEDKAWRGNLNLVWGDMVLERDPSNGVEYLTLATYVKKANRNNGSGATPNTGSPGMKSSSRTRTGTQTSKLRAAAAAAGSNSPNINTLMIDTNSPIVYARQPASWCPIEAYKMYRSRRPNNCLDRDSPFYLAPLFKSKNNSKVWYKALAMSCQRLDALFYCLFKKAGVDLNSLATMSAQQQQQAVAAAASIIGTSAEVNLPSGNHLNISTAAMNNAQIDQWKNSIKENQSQVSYDILLLNNGNNKHIDLHQQQLHQQQQHQTNTLGVYNINTSTNQSYGQAHHIVTTVPAQVQVQVQVQVQPSHLQHHQQATINGQNSLSETTLLV